MLVIARIVPVGKRIFQPAQSRHTARKFARSQLFRALEHHVLQHVRHARGAIDFIHGPYAQPQHVHGCGRTAIRLHDELHAIAQSELLHRRGRVGR